MCEMWKRNQKRDSFLPVLRNTMVNSNGVKEYNDFSRDMVIALFIGICILIKMMIGMAVLIVWTHWPLISTIIESFIRR